MTNAPTRLDLLLHANDPYAFPEDLTPPTLAQQQRAALLLVDFLNAFPGRPEHGTPAADVFHQCEVRLKSILYSTSPACFSDKTPEELMEFVAAVIEGGTL